MSENRQNQPRTNEERVLLHFLVICFWDYKLNLQKVSDKLESLLFKRIKPDKNNPLKIIVWEIPSTKEEKKCEHFKTKNFILAGINKLKIYSIQNLRQS